MNHKTLAAVAAVGLAAAIAIPSIASGNARQTTGSLAAVNAAGTPYIAALTGPAETPTTGDPDGLGAAAVSFHVTGVAEAEVCWDLSYSGIDAPTAAHIHRGAIGVAGPIVVPLVNLGATSGSGCAPIDVALATEIKAGPAGFYVNVHNAAYAAGAISGQLAKGPEPAGSLHFLPTPLRAYDSRDNAGAKIAAGETRTIGLAAAKDLAGTSQIAVPPGATGAVVTLTITETVGAGGFLKLYSAGSTEPSASSINWSAVNQNVAVSTQVAVDASGRVKVTAGANATHFVIDVIGYLY